MEEKINEIKELVLQNYSSAKCGWTAERSMGNFDDCFDDGVESGTAYFAYQIGYILEMNLEEPEEPSYE